LIKAGYGTMCFEVRKLIKFIRNKEELPKNWQELIIVPNYKKGEKTDCSNYGGLLLLLTTYTILSNTLLSRLTLYAGEITGDYQYGFKRNRSITYHTCCIRQIPEKKWEYSEAVHKLFLDFNKAYFSVRRKVLFNFLTEFGIPMKEVRLIKSV
jgi:hypothetical protein